MVTRRELVAEIEALGEDLGEPVHTDRLNNAALTELVERMRARVEERKRPPAPIATGAQRAQRAQAEPKQEPPAAQPSHHAARPKAKPHAEPVDGAAPAGAGGPPEPKAEQPAPPKAPYYVARGQSTIAGGRVVGPFKEVRAADFARGQEDLDYLVLRGVVIRSGS